MVEDTKYLGVSQPISTAKPDAADVKLSETLVETLNEFKLFETQEELQHRIGVLGKMNAILKDWIQEVSKSKLPGEDCSNVGGKLFTFGSYRLGVHNRGADIDTLCVAPRHVDRAAFFESFYAILKADPDVSELHAVTEAFVPVIKLRYRGIELDLLFARLATRAVPDDQSLSDDMILKNLDDKSIRSLNGCRVADEILRAVPSQETFVVCLRAIKHWAKTRGVYSNTLGFFGGITWGILTARICQLYPNAAPSKLIHKFFYVFGQWQWPHPVFLKDMDNNSHPELSTLQELVWDPRIRPADRYHLMPIVTPAFPEQNSTFNVTNSTKTIITRELNEAFDICNEVVAGKANWSKLFEEINFFTRYKHFIVITCAAKTEEDYLIFNGFVESKIRMLIGCLERNQGINLAHINPRQYKPVGNAPLNIGYENPVVNLWFVGLDFDPSLAKNIDLTTEISQFMTTLANNRSKYPHNDDMKVDLKYVHQKDLKLYITREDMLKGKRYQKKKPVLSRSSSDAGNNLAGDRPPPSPGIVPEGVPLKHGIKEDIDSSITASEVKKEADDTVKQEIKEEVNSNSTGDTADGVLKNDLDTVIKKEIKEEPMQDIENSLGSQLPSKDSSDTEDLKPVDLNSRGMKRSFEEESASEMPQEKKTRQDVTVA